MSKPSPPKRTAKNSRFLDLDEDQHSDDSEKDRYLITYADLITLLLGLFIILYTISNIDSKKYQAILSAFGNTFGNDREIVNLSSKTGAAGVIQVPGLKDKLSDLVESHGYDNFIKLEENERGIVIHILDQILFTSGSARLEQKSFEILSKLAAIIKEVPNDIRIEGHTDNIPIHSSEFPSNWHLSVARALNTAYYFIDVEMLSQDKLSVVGYSEYKPIASNETVEDRAKNRRVDIIIIKK
ncbi:MAG: OmpA family protein [Ignavibacteriaceae bacterium]